MKHKWNERKFGNWTAAILTPLVLLAQPDFVIRIWNGLLTGNLSLVVMSAFGIMLLVALLAVTGSGVCRLRNWIALRGNNSN